MNRKALVLLATAGSAFALLAAFSSQFIGGLVPCHLCLLQRWPHGAAVLAGGLFLIFGGRIWIALGGLAALTTSALGLYHSGVEQHWWEGPTTCTSAPIGGLTPDQLMSQILTTPLVRCDEISWTFLGLSMASWNAIASLALAMIWAAALTRSGRFRES